jgi:hypothetical protein
MSIRLRTANISGNLITSAITVSNNGLAFTGTTLSLNSASDGNNALTITGSTVGGFLALRPDGTNGSVIRFGGDGANANTLRFLGVADDEFMRLANGNIGIGTTSPAAKLSVDGSVIFNDSGADVDFRVEGDTDANLLFVDASADKVGIGTNTPARKLEVIASADIAGQFVRTSSATNARQTTVNIIAETSADMVNGFGTVINNQIKDNAGVLNSIGNFGFFRSGADNSGSFYIQTLNAGTPADSLILNPSGNLGLGVTPSAWFSNAKALEYQGGSLWSSATSNMLLMQNAYLNASAEYIYKNTGAASYYSQSSGAHTWFNVASGTAGGTISAWTQAMTLDASNQLLLGTTSTAPITEFTGGAVGLTVQSGAPVIALVDSDDTTNYRSWLANLSGVLYLYNKHSTSPLIFGTNNTERARITSGGLFGIGTTNIANLLQVAGALGLDHSAMASAATSGDFKITVSGLQSLAAGNAWYVTSVLVFYVGIDGDQTNGNLLLTALYLRGLGTWDLNATNNIVGTASVSATNGTATSVELNFNVSDNNFGSVYALVLGGNGGSRPTISIAG